MFTGIVHAMGTVRRIEANPFGVRLIVDPASLPRPLPGALPGALPGEGDSVCVSGVCLTHTAPGQADREHLAFDVIRETLDKTNLGMLREGDKVNLELSLTPSTPMGGHFVQGHVDAQGRVVEVIADEAQWRITYEVDPAILRYIIPKGSVALDGVSMTIAAVDVRASRFMVALIPTTIRETTLGAKRIGDTSNIETDMIARAIVHQLSLMGEEEKDEGVTLVTLRKAGFV